MKRACAWLQVLSVLAVASGTAAAAPELSRVVVLVPAGQERVEHRLRAELGVLGFAAVSVHDDAAQLSRAHLEDVARQAQAVAVISIVPLAHGAEVWILDRVTGKVVLREVVFRDQEDPTGGELALRAVELLRASLMEVRASHPSRGEVSPPPAVDKLVGPGPSVPGGSAGGDRRDAQTRGFAMDLGAAALWSPGGLGVSAHALVGAAWNATDGWGVHVHALIPLQPATVAGAEGEADISTALVGAGLHLDLARAHGPLRVRAGVGVAVARTEMRGRATPAYASRVDAVVGAVFYARPTVSWSIGHALSLRTDVLVGWAVPRANVAFAGREVAHWGEPLVCVSAGLELSL